MRSNHSTGFGGPSASTVLTFALALTVHVPQSLAQAPRLSEWVAPVSGSWTDASKWSTNDSYPQDGQPAVYWWYTARIGVSGAPFTIDLASDVSITKLEMQSADATLHIDHAALTMRQDVSLDAGEVFLDGAEIHGGAWHMSGGSIRVGDPVNWYDLDVRDADIHFDRGTVTIHDSLNLNGNALVFDSYGTLVLYRMDHFDDRLVIGSGSLEFQIDRPFTFGANAHVSGDTLYLRDTHFPYGKPVTNDGIMDLQGIDTFGVSIVNNGSITLAGGSSRTTRATSTFGLTNNSLVQIHGVDAGLSGVTNAGTILADEGSRLGLDLVSNTGLIEVSTGARLSLDADPGLVNTGIIRATGSTVFGDFGFDRIGTLDLIDSDAELRGAFNPTTIGTIHRTGATDLHVWTFDTQGSTVDLADTFDGDVRFNTLIGGTIIQSPGARLRSGALDSTTVLGGDLVVDISDPTSFGFTIKDSLNLPDGDIHTIGSGYAYGSLGFRGTQTITGYNLILEAESSTGVSVGNDTVLTLAPDAMIRGGSASFQSTSSINPTGSFVNNGLVSADLPLADGYGPIRFLFLDHLTNNATMQAINGGRIDILADQWTNEGLIAAVDSSLRFHGDWQNNGTISLTRSTLSVGTMSTSQLGTVDAVDSRILSSGTWDNTGQSLDFSDRSLSVELTGNGDADTFKGGSVVLAPGQTFGNSALHGFLTDTAVTGDILGDGGTLTLAGSTSFTGNLLFAPGTGTTVNLNGLYSTIDFDILGQDPQNPMCTGEIQFNADEVTIPSGTTIGGLGVRLTNAAHLVNEGTLISDFPSLYNISSVGAHVGLFENDGVMTVHTGSSLYIGAQHSINRSLIEAYDGKITLNGDWMNEGTIALHDSLLALDGSYAPSDIGTITHTGESTVRFNGTLQLDEEVLAIDDFGLRWEVDNAYVTGGTFDLRGSTSDANDHTLHVGGPDGYARFRNVMIRGGTLVVDPDDRLYILGTLAITGATLLNDGYLSFDQPGYLASDSGVEFGDGSALGWTINGPPDLGALLRVGGSIVLGGGLGVSLSDEAPIVPSGAYYPILLGSDYEGRFAGFSYYGPRGTRASIRYTPEGIFLVVVPEPGAVCVMAMLAAGVLRRRR